MLQTFPIHYSFDEEVGFVFIVICFLTVYVMHIAYCLADKKKKSFSLNLPVESNLKKIGKFVMLLFLVPVIVKGIIQFNYIRTHGYTALFTDKFSELVYPFWTSGSFIFFISGYCVFLAANPNKKDFLIFTLVLCFVYFVNALKGQRGGIISVILYCVYYYTKHFSVKMNLERIMMLFVFIIVFIIMLGNIRSFYGQEKKSKTKIDVGNLVVQTIYGQTTTRAVPMLVIRGDMEYHNFPFVFSPIFQPLFGLIYRDDKSGQSDLSAQKTNNISQVTMYNVSRSAHLSGLGYGSAFIAEAYDFFGIVGVFLFSILLARFFVFLDFSGVNAPRIVVPFLYFALQNSFVLPRGRTFGMFMEWSKILFAYILFFVATISVYIFKFKRGAK